MKKRTEGLKEGLVDEIALSDQLTVYRYRDRRRWRKPVDGRHRNRTHRFYSSKNQCDAEGESTGENALLSFLEISPSIAAYREQLDLVRLLDAEGVYWTVPDVSVETVSGPAWIEGKNEITLDEEQRAHLLMFQQAFAAAGHIYRVIDQGWCRKPIIAQNIFYAFHNRDLKVSAADIKVAKRAVSNGPITLGSLCKQLSDPANGAALAFAMMAQRHIEIPLNCPFSFEMPVTAVSAPCWHNDGR